MWLAYHVSRYHPRQAGSQQNNLQGGNASVMLGLVGFEAV
jgi:hypothetical protein